jgi:hypothetical protein
MAYRKLTGQISHRHPFHDYYSTPDMYDFDIASIDKLYKGVQGYEVTEPVAGPGAFDAQSVANTVVTGAIVGLGTYGVARLLLAKPVKTSRTWGLFGGGLVAAMSLLADVRGA